MKTKGFIRFLCALLVIAAICFVAICGIPGTEKLGSASQVRLGLDLAGGVSITYEIVKDDPTQSEIDDTVYKMQKRAESISTEAEVYPEGEKRITVAIPDVSDADEVLSKLGKAGNIYFIYAVSPSGTANVAAVGADENGEIVYALTRPMEDIIADGDVVIDGSHITGAEPHTYTDNMKGLTRVVDLDFNAAGSTRFSEATGYAAQYRTEYLTSGYTDLRNVIAIVYDGEVVSAPGVTEAITGGSAQISGQSTDDESRMLATTIRVGALPLELSVLRYHVEGAQLGANALDTSLAAGVIGLAIIILFMIIMYRIPGLAASLALLFYVALTVITINMFEVTLTLPGIAGIILSIGMAVDANVIIFTRIQEEVGTGKTIRSSIKLGFDKALSAIIDGNVTTIIAGVVLFYLGSGTVKGFAETLIIGIILSMITAFYVTKFILTSLFMMGINSEAAYGEVKHNRIHNFVGKFKPSVIIACCVFIIGIGSIIFNVASTGDPFNYGLDFKGGTATTITFDGELPANIRTDLEQLSLDAIGEAAVVSVADSESVATVRTKELSTEERAILIDKLKSTYNIPENMISTESVGATVSGEMKKDAVVAVIVATICMLIYIWFRFKNLNFGLASVLALLHDVFVVIAVYAVAKSFISVGNTFIACLLTIIGYSINATIVSFDRIRENLAEKASKESFGDIVNKSVTQTFTRSLYTSLTTFVMVLLLAILGVASVREFAIPLMAGIVAGGFSSIMLASGIWYFLQRKLKGADNGKVVVTK